MDQNEFRFMKDEIVGLATDLGEPALGAILNNEIIKEIPILGTAVRLAKIGYAVPNLIFANKVRGFLRGSESIDRGTREDFYLELSANSEKAKQAGEILIQAIDRAEDRQKAALIGRLFAHYVISDMSLLELRRLFFAVDRGFLHDLLCFPQWALTSSPPDNFDPRSLDGTGLVEPVYASIKIGSQGGKPKYGFTPLGEKYRTLMLGYKPDL